MVIAVYVSRLLSLLEQGQLTAALERSLGRDVDLFVLNTVLDHNPALAYRAITEGTLLFCRDRKTFVDFKTRAMVRYLDTAFLQAAITYANEDVRWEPHLEWALRRGSQPLVRAAGSA